MSIKSMDQRLNLLIDQGWQLCENGQQICRSYDLKTFDKAFALMEQIAKQAEIMNHHPDWSNSYGHLHICLTTHSRGTISLKDIELAEFAEQQAQLLLPDTDESPSAKE